MTKQSMGKNYSKVINILIFIFPIVINSLQVVGDIVLFILAMMGICIAISKKLSPLNIKEIKVFSYLTIGYFIAICLSVIFSGQAKELAHYIPRDFYFIFAPFIALALYKAEINLNYLLVGAKVALLVLGVIVIYQLLGEEYPRPSGLMNANVFGNLSVSLFLIVLVFSKHETLNNKIFTFFSLLSGCLIILASGSRGAWLSFFLLLVVYLYFFYKQKTKLSTNSKIFVALIIVGILSIANFNQSGRLIESVNERIYSVYIQTSNWVLGENTSTPVGLRLNMYKKAIDNIEDVPFFGHGLRTSNIALFKNDLSSMGRVSVRFNHLHNAYLTNYFNGGIILLGALLLLLFLPLRIFIKANSQNRENPVFISGALLTLGYASYGMVNILLGDTYMNGFYIFFLAIFMLLTNQSIKTPKT